MAGNGYIYPDTALPAKWSPLVSDRFPDPLRILYFETIDSTNSEARKAAEKGAAEGAIFLADSQTSGRGSKNRSWASQDLGGIYFSTLFRPPWRPLECLIFTRLAAIAVYDNLHSLWTEGDCPPCSLQIKPPNDILLKGRKVCGILVESASIQESTQHVIVGIGINVNQVAFPLELRSLATSLRIEMGRSFDQANLLGAIIRDLWDQYCRAQTHGLEFVSARWKHLTGESQ